MGSVDAVAGAAASQVSVTVWPAVSAMGSGVLSGGRRDGDGRVLRGGGFQAMTGLSQGRGVKRVSRV